MTARTATDDAFLSAECALAKESDYKDMHGWCRRTRDIPLPGVRDILLMRRCPCACHRRSGGGGR